MQDVVQDRIVFSCPIEDVIGKMQWPVCHPALDKVGWMGYFWQRLRFSRVDGNREGFSLPKAFYEEVKLIIYASIAGIIYVGVEYGPVTKVTFCSTIDRAVEFPFVKDPHYSVA